MKTFYLSVLGVFLIASSCSTSNDSEEPQTVELTGIEKAFAEGGDPPNAEYKELGENQTYRMGPLKIDPTDLINRKISLPSSLSSNNWSNYHDEVVTYIEKHKEDETYSAHLQKLALMMGYRILELETTEKTREALRFYTDYLIEKDNPEYNFYFGLLSPSQKGRESILSTGQKEEIQSILTRYFSEIQAQLDQSNLGEYKKASLLNSKNDLEQVFMLF